MIDLKELMKQQEGKEKQPLTLTKIEKMEELLSSLSDVSREIHRTQMALEYDPDDNIQKAYLMALCGLREMIYSEMNEV